MGVVSTLVVRVGGDISPFEKAMAGLEKSLGRTGAKFQSIGRDLTIGLTAPIAAVMGLSVKAASDFESSFAGVRKTVDGVVDAGGNITGFGKKLQERVPRAGKRDPRQRQRAEPDRRSRPASSGSKANRLSSSQMRTIADMSVATNLSAEQAADGMARFANITQMPQEKIGNLGSVIVELGNKLAATESEILDFGLRIAGAGEIVRADREPNSRHRWGVRVGRDRSRGRRHGRTSKPCWR